MTRRWVLACVAAESVGMAASAGAARLADATSVPLGFAAVIGGGLVEGSALGLFQAGVLRPWLGDRSWRWTLATVLVAGVGWAAGSAPSVLTSGATGADGAEPPLVLVLAGAAALGTGMGALLGAAQAVVVRRRLAHPWRWVLVSAGGWSLAMPVVFAGATSSGAGWPVPVVMAYGGLTGALAGAVLGQATAPWLPAVLGPRPSRVPAGEDQGPAEPGPHPVGSALGRP